MTWGNFFFFLIGYEPSCLTCPYRPSCIIGEQSQKVLREFSGALKRHVLLSKGKIIFHQGDPSSGYHFLCAGAVKLVKLLHTGNQIIIDVLEPFSFLSLIPERKGQGHRCTAVTLAEWSEVASIGERELHSLFSRHPSLAFAVASYFSQRLRLAGRLLACIKLPVRDRLIAYLASRISTGPLTGKRPMIDLRLPRKDFAEVIQTTPETLSRTFRQLEKEGVLRTRGSVIEVIDLDLVRSYFEDDLDQERRNN